jgi:hypothetical protein
MNPPRIATAIFAVIGATALAAGCGTSQSVSAAFKTTNLVLEKGSTNTTTSATCDPPSPPRPDPVGRWNAEPAQNKTLVATGFEVYRNSTDSCTEHMGVLYRGIVEYDLAPVIALKGTTTKAVLTFWSKILPSGVTPNASNLCDPHDGGLGSLMVVTPTPVQIQNTAMVDLTGPNASFPTGNKLVAFPIPWISGPISGTNASSTASGTGGAAFTVDVTGAVLTALGNNKTTIQFMLSGSDEAFPRSTPPPSGFDCRTLVEFNQLDVTVNAP